MSLDLPALRLALAPWRLHYRPVCRSTSDLAARMRREGRLYAPAAVFTPCQTAGRGRGQNTWSSDPGTLTVTFALPVNEEVPPQQLPIVAGVAVREACAALLGDLATDAGAIQLKWPNDILIGGKKLAGLLCERIENVDLIGLGLNVSTRLGQLPRSVRDRATSLELAGRRLPVTEVLAIVAGHLRRATEVREPFSATLRRYDPHHILVGRNLTVRTTTDAGDPLTLTGTCRGLDAQGRLLLQSATTTHRLSSATIESW